MILLSLLLHVSVTRGYDPLQEDLGSKEDIGCLDHSDCTVLGYKFGCLVYKCVDYSSVTGCDDTQPCPGDTEYQCIKTYLPGYRAGVCVPSSSLTTCDPGGCSCCGDWCCPARYRDMWLDMACVSHIQCRTWGTGQFCCSDNQCCNELDSYDEYYDYDYYTGTTYSDYSSTAKYEDILYHYTPYNTHIEDSVRVNDTETGGEISSENEEQFENSSNVSLMITETSDDALDDNVTLRVSDGVDIALNSDDTETTVTEDVTDEAGDKWETNSSDSDADAVSEDNVSILPEDQEEEHGEGVSLTTVKIVAMDDQSDDTEDTQISATFYETISETENASEILEEDNKNDDRAEIVNINLTLSKEDLYSEEDKDEGSYDNTMENVIEDSYDEMFSTEADTAEVSAVEFIGEEYYYEQEMTLENPFAYFEDIEDEDLFSSGGHSKDIELLEISGSGEILKDVSSSAEFREELDGNSLDEYIEEMSEEDFLGEREETLARSNLFSTIGNLFEDNPNSTSEEDETSTQVNIVDNYILDWQKKEESRHPKLISSWQEKSHSCQKTTLSTLILFTFLLSFILYL